MRNNTILLLASDRVIRNAFTRALESAGYFVLSASNLGAAMELAKNCTPDLLMIRHYTESISGHDAAMFMRLKYPGLRTLLVGGLLEDAELEHREALHGIEIFPKPFRAADLIDKVQEVLMKRPQHHRATGSGTAAPSARGSEAP
jgi:DNA-binding NtrC family response regulator